jgi:hypothetical protein
MFCFHLLQCWFAGLRVELGIQRSSSSASSWTEKLLDVKLASSHTVMTAWKQKLRGKHTSAPDSLIFISFSISTHCCSSAKANAYGTPSNNALVLTTHKVLPANIVPDQIQLVVVSTLLAMYDRVVGGIMSRRAEIRSASVSSSGISSSSSVEISESSNIVSSSPGKLRNGTYQCLCIHPRLMGRPASSRRTRPRLLLIRPS